jgi:high-affinity iron transporter
MSQGGAATVISVTRTRGLVVVALLLVAAFAVATGAALAASPQDDLKDANAGVQRALTAARGQNLGAARQAYDQYENTWFDIEDGVRASSRDAYVAIERAMTAVASAFAATPPDAARVADALVALDREQQAFITGQAPAQTSQSRAPVAPSMQSELDLLADAQAALAKNDFPTAATRLKSFETAWLDVEGQVKTRSADDYRQTETDMALASTLASQNSPQTVDVVNRMATRLQPYRTAQSYGIFDADIIILREGLEALLVIVALSAFLRKSGNAAGQTWLWLGATAGLVLSIALGLAIQAFFGAIVNPSNRELLEGVIGLFAAVMLIYVSYWLHSKASLGGWQRYIDERTSQAIQGGQLFGLAVLAFLAVFREGAETALFYLGMVGNISTSDLLSGLGAGFGGLAVLGFLMLVVGVRIPMRPFFTVASVLVFYLCFKFAGTGVHALQVSGLVPAGSASYLPTFDFLGLYPTWPTTIAQVVLLAAAAWVVLRERLAHTARGSAAVSVALLMLSMACAPAAAPAPAPTSPAAAPTVAAQTAALPAAPAIKSGRKEATLVAGPRHRLEEAFAALQKSDIGATRAAMEAYDSDWNGIEVWVNVRSRALYGEIETHYQADINTALQDPTPDARAIMPMLQAMVEQYDEAIRLSDTGPALSPLFEDVATVRTVRAPLRTISPALKAGDTVKALAGYTAFKAHWVEAEPLFAARSEDAQKETAAALGLADKAMTAPSVNAAEAGPLVDKLLERYNFGVNLLNAAARNADTSRASFGTDDVQAAATLGGMQRDLRTSLTTWQAGNRSAAAEAARSVAGPRFESVSAALQARAGADATVKKALDAYAPLAEQAGDAAQTQAANKAAIEAIAIGQQALVGQFWTDAGFIKAYQAALETK